MRLLLKLVYRLIGRTLCTVYPPITTIYIHLVVAVNVLSPQVGNIQARGEIDFE